MRVTTPADLASYQFNIRSFHPEKTFGWSGMEFEGDDRRFSLRPSGQGLVTSRIWHRFTLDTEVAVVTKRETESDLSRASQSFGGEGVAYRDALKPRSWQAIHAETTPDRVRRLRVIGGYSGENHAMFKSDWLQENLGVTYVPSLNVNYKLWMDVDRNQRHVDIVLYVTGDGFPNCEAFVVGPGGQAVFLGVHVRKGLAPVSLALNTNRPMIACAIRLPITRDGHFRGTVADELARRELPGSELAYQTIESWNGGYGSTSPNEGRCMAVEQLTLRNLRSLECVSLVRPR